MSVLKKRARKFLEKYDIKLLSESKRCMTKFPQITHFTFSSDKDQCLASAPSCSTEPLITIDIPLSKLNEIADVEAIFFDNIDDSRHRRMFQDWVNQQHEERRLRESYKAVKEAYEHYSAMLAWCGKPNKKITDLPPEE